MSNKEAIISLCQLALADSDNFNLIQYLAFISCISHIITLDKVVGNDFRLSPNFTEVIEKLPPSIAKDYYEIFNTFDLELEIIIDYLDEIYGKP